MVRPLSGMSQVWSLFLSQVSLLLFLTIHSLQGLARNMVDLADFLPLSFVGDVACSFLVVDVQGPNIRAAWYNDIWEYMISCIRLKKNMLHMTYECVLRYTQDHISCG